MYLPTAKFEKIVASSGSDELIDILIRLFLEPNDKLIDAQPTFGMYEFFAKIQGAEVVSVKRGKDFGLDLEGITIKLSIRKGWWIKKEFNKNNI